MSRWLVRVVRWGPSWNKGTWSPRAADSLCTKVTGVPVRVYAANGRLAHPEGAAAATEVGTIERAWSTDSTDGVLAVARLANTPRAAVVDRGMRRLAARGLLDNSIGCSLVAQVRFSLEHPSLPILGVDSVVALDLVYPPASGGWVIRALEPDEDPSTPRKETTTP